MVADYNNHLIRRFDGDTGVALGTFGSRDLLNPTAITVNAVLGHAYVYDQIQGKIFTYNYHTGEYVRELSAASEVYTLSVTSNGDLLEASDTGNAFRIDHLTGALLSTYVRPNTATGSSSIIQVANGNIHVAHQGSNTISTYSLTGTLLGTSAPVSGSIASASSSAIFGTTGMLVDWTGKRVVRYTSANTPIPITPFDVSGQFVQPRGLAMGHGSRLYVVGTNPGSTLEQIVSYDASTGLARSTFGTSPSTSSLYSSIAIVNAPEPGSLVVLGAMSLAAVVRKRRAK